MHMAAAAEAGEISELYWTLCASNNLFIQSTLCSEKSHMCFTVYLKHSWAILKDTDYNYSLVVVH